MVRACGSYPQCRGFKSLPCYQNMTGSPEIFRASFVMDFFAACPEMRDSARRVLPVLHGRAGRRVRGCPGRDRLLEDFRIRPSFGGLLRSRDGKSPEPFRQEKQPRPRSFRPGPLREFFSLPGENTEKACQRRASSVDASLRCGKSTKPYGKVAQLVRACGSYPQCRGFKSLPCYQKLTSGSGLSRTAFLLWLYL